MTNPDPEEKPGRGMGFWLLVGLVPASLIGGAMAYLTLYLCCPDLLP